MASGDITIAEMHKIKEMSMFMGYLIQIATLLDKYADEGDNELAKDMGVVHNMTNRDLAQILRDEINSIMRLQNDYASARAQLGECRERENNIGAVLQDVFSNMDFDKCFTDDEKAVLDEYAKSALAELTA